MVKFLQRRIKQPRWCVPILGKKLPEGWGKDVSWFSRDRTLRWDYGIRSADLLMTAGLRGRRPLRDRGQDCGLGTAGRNRRTHSYSTTGHRTRSVLHLQAQCGGSRSCERDYQRKGQRHQRHRLYGAT